MTWGHNIQNRNRNPKAQKKSKRFGFKFLDSSLFFFNESTVWTIFQFLWLCNHHQSCRSWRHRSFGHSFIGEYIIISADIWLHIAIIYVFIYRVNISLTLKSLKYNINRSIYVACNNGLKHSRDTKICVGAPRIQKTRKQGEIPGLWTLMSKKFEIFFANTFKAWKWSILDWGDHLWLQCLSR